MPKKKQFKHFKGSTVHKEGNNPIITPKDNHQFFKILKHLIEE